MQTLATESASTTFTGNRATLDGEYQTLVGEINREASNVGLGTSNATNATNLSVYIGGGQSSASGSAVNVNLANSLVDAAALGLQGTSVGGATPVTVGAVTNGLIVDGDTETYTVNTASGSSTFGITGQSGDTQSSQLARLNADLGTLGVSASLDSTGKLAFSSPTAFSVDITAGTAPGLGAVNGTPIVGHINTSLSNATMSYTKADLNDAVATDSTFGFSSSYTVTEGTTKATINLVTNLDDSQALSSINSQLQKQGITDLAAVSDGTGTAGAFSLQGAQSFTIQKTFGTGLAVVPTTATAAIGGGGALNAINAVTAAVQLLGKVQGTVGAGENDLNYAIGLANSQITNFSATESSIRDADVAKEAADLTKAQVLEQASVAAMAQANSAPQAILSLLKG
jgi:flagellin